MTTISTSHYPRNHLVFYIGKIMRSGPIEDAYRRKGHVWFTPLKGRRWLEARLRKIIEECKEAFEVHTEYGFNPTRENRHAILSELADISDNLDLFERDVESERAGNLEQARNQWEQHLVDFLAGRVYTRNLDQSIAYTRNSISRYLHVHNIGKQELADAIRHKQIEKGDFLHGQVDFIALPKNDEWVSYYRQRYPLVSAHHVSAPPSPLRLAVTRTG